MSVTIRPATSKDASSCGVICYAAFKAIAEQHRFPPAFPNSEIATQRLAGLLSHAGFYAVVAELEGRIVGSNFIDERSTIAGIGPITVDPVAFRTWPTRRPDQYVDESRPLQHPHGGVSPFNPLLRLYGRG
jgi:hypothetical protein